MSKAQELLLWTDLETAGTDEEHDPILEIGCVLTDSTLTELFSFEATVWPVDWDKGVPSYVNGEVIAMHQASGLWDDCARDGVYLGKAERELLTLMKDYGQRHDFVLAGSGVREQYYLSQAP